MVTVSGKVPLAVRKEIEDEATAAGQRSSEWVRGAIMEKLARRDRQKAATDAAKGTGVGNSPAAF